MMGGIRRLFIAESKDTRKKDSAWPSGIFDFYTPNKGLVRKRSRATQSTASKNQSNHSFAKKFFIIVHCRWEVGERPHRRKEFHQGVLNFKSAPSSSENRHILRLFGKNRDRSLQTKFFTAAYRAQRPPGCASTVYRNRRGIFPKSGNARGTKFADYQNTSYYLPI